MAAEPELTVFIYKGKNKRGEKIKGDITSRNLELAKAQLRKQYVQVETIKKKPKPLYEMKQKISSLDMTIFIRQMATMMKAGVPLVQSFGIVAESSDNPTMRDMILGIKKEVENGSTFSQSLRKYPRHFDDLVCSLIDSGEQSGALETMLDRVALYKEKSEALKAKIKSAMKYPIAVLTIAFIVTSILLVKVVPVFGEVFESFGSELPAFTQMVVNWSEWMQANWYFVVGGVVVFVVIFKYLKRTSKKFQNQLDRLSLKLPIFGTVIYSSIIARFGRTLATTFAAGVPLMDALESTAGACNNIVFYNGTMQIKEDVASGQQLQFAMKTTNLFPSMAIQMVGIGEESGKVDEMLEKVATHYETIVDEAVDGLTSLMEPIIMVFLGVVIGGLVIAMYLPIFMMGSVV